ncbi:MULTISPECIES: hypothetical protein [unclassified Parabacteroides]|nr:MULTISPECIES: hypothetical protein [unclassified Parabacteroides]
MKDNRKRRGVSLILYSTFIIFLFFILLLGCDVGRQSQRHYQAVEMGEWVRKDSVHMQRLIKQLKNKQVKIEHVEFMPPDSSERQFVQSVSHIVIEEKAEEMEQVAIRTGAEKEVLRQATTRLSEKAKKKRNSYYPFAILLVVGVFFVLRRRMNSK